MIPFYKEEYLPMELNQNRLFNTERNVNVRNLVAQHFQSEFLHKNFFLTKSCTQSLEIAIMTLNLPKNSEVIMPSYGFVSIANAVSINGLKCVFVDCDPNTMNVSIEAIQNAITKKTKAVITINYSGVACDYDQLLPICKEKDIYLIEDNAHGIRAKYNGNYLGTFGDISTISFDFYKNISCGEGGGITINHNSLLRDFHRVYHFGTNKKDFLEGKVNTYEWKGYGTNSILAEPLAVILKGQLDRSEKIIQMYKNKWNVYYDELLALEKEGYIRLLKVPEYAEHNAHIFWLKVNSADIRNSLIKFLGKNGIETTFHYRPLHTSEFGKKTGEFRGEDKYTSKESNELLRLPHYYSLKETDQSYVIEKIYEFYR